MTDRQLDPLPGLAFIILLMATLANLVISTRGRPAADEPSLVPVHRRELDREPSPEVTEQREIVARFLRRIAELHPTDMRTFPHGE